MRLWRRPEIRLAGLNSEYRIVWFEFKNGEPEFGESGPVMPDEIWHTKAPLQSFAEGREATRRVLSLAQETTQSKKSVIHYLSSSLAAGRMNSTPELAAGEDESGSDEECHRWNEEAVAKSGCAFRIIRTPLIADAGPTAADAWARFTRLVGRFRIEIEDRIPGYFTANPLRIGLSGEGVLSLVRLDEVVSALEASREAREMGSGFIHMNAQRPVRLREYLPVLAEVTGVRLLPEFGNQPANFIDRLFELKMGELRLCLDRPETVPREPGAWLTVPPAELREVLAGLHSASAGAAPSRGWRELFQEKELSLPGGRTLKYFTGGEGTRTLVLLNAYGQSFGYWEKFLREIAGHLRVILWVPRGNDGGTIGLRLPSPLAVHADDLDRVLEHEGVETCAVAAWCSGPKLALEFCLRYPHRVSSMVLVAASLKGLVQHKTLETDYEKNLEPLLETVEKYPETADVVLEYLKGILLAQNKQTRSNEELAAMTDADIKEALAAVNVNLREMVLHPFHAANIVAYAKQMRDFWQYDILPAVGRIETPVVFVGGDSDRIASQAIVKAVAAMIPGARFLEIKGGSHYLQFEEWDLLAQVVRDVVNSGGKIRLKQAWVSLAESAGEFANMRLTHT